MSPRTFNVQGRTLARGYFVVPGPPVGYLSGGRRRRAKGDPRATAYTAFLAAVANAFAEARSLDQRPDVSRPIPVVASAAFGERSSLHLFPRPLEATAALRVSVEALPHYRTDNRPDPVNVTKAVTDALFRHAPGGDRWVRELGAWPTYDPEEPRTIVLLDLVEFAAFRVEEETFPPPATRSVRRRVLG